MWAQKHVRKIQVQHASDWIIRCEAVCLEMLQPEENPTNVKKTSLKTSFITISATAVEKVLYTYKYICF